MKLIITVSIDQNLLKKIEDYQSRKYSGLSRSAVIEMLLRNALPKEIDYSVVK